MKNKDNTHKLSKRAKLYIANLAALAAVIIFTMIQVFAFGSADLLVALTAIFVFVLLSLVVYFLSIIADALDERNKLIDEYSEEETKN